MRLLGSRSDCERLYQAMDLMLFPSRYEGLGMAAIEAQVRGVRVLASTSVPREAQISDGLEFLSLDAGAAAWAGAVPGPAGKANLQGGRLAAYDIRRQASRLEAFYEEVWDAQKEAGLGRRKVRRRLYAWLQKRC